MLFFTQMFICGNPRWEKVMDISGPAIATGGLLLAAQPSQESSRLHDGNMNTGTSNRKTYFFITL